MQAFLIEYQPLNTATGSRVTLRVASAQDRRITGLNNVPWWPALTDREPSRSHSWFDGDFTGAISTGSASLEIALSALGHLDPAAASYAPAGAPVTIYAAEPGTAWPWPLWFKGKIQRFGNTKNALQIECAVDTEPFDADAMTALYAGTTGAEGPADLKNKVKPWCLGTPRGIEPVTIDVVNSVLQVSGYGAIHGITAVYERAASLGSSIGDYASYAALVAATIPAGRWATCLALGMFRLGAPPQGIITADVEGDNVAGWARKTGAIISRICANAGISGSIIDSASLTALDTAVPYNVSIYLTEQTKIIDLVQRLARPCNAAAGIGFDSKLFVSRFGAIGSPVATLDAQARQMPPVTDCKEESVSPPYGKLEIGYAKCWRTHSPTEISFYADIIDKGTYAGATSYREGNIVDNQGARWLYVNPVASAGNAPPTLPTTSNSWWQLLKDKLDFADVAGSTKPADNATRNVNRGAWAGSTAYVAGDIVTYGGSSYTCNAAHTSSTGTPPPNSFFVLLVAAGADAVSPYALSLQSEQISIAATYAGVTKSGQLSKTITVTFKQGATDITTAGTTSIAITPSSGDITASYSGGTITITVVDAAGYIDVVASVSGTAQGSKRLQITRPRDAAPPASQTSASDTFASSFSNTSFSGPIGATVVLKANGSGQLVVAAGADYTAQGSTSVRNFRTGGCFAYRPASGGAWSYTTEVLGGTATTPATGDPVPSSIAISQTISSLSAGALYEVGSAFRRYSGTTGAVADIDGSFSVSQ